MRNSVTNCVQTKPWRYLDLRARVFCLTLVLVTGQASGDEGKVKNITFDNIKLDTEAGAPYDASLLTDEVKALHKVRVQLRGFMLPANKQDGIRNFILIRDNLECCFGPNAAIHDSVVIVLEKGIEVSFTVRPVAVEGTFLLKELRPRKDSRPLAIYRMIDAKLVR